MGWVSWAKKYGGVAASAARTATVSSLAALLDVRSLASIAVVELSDDGPGALPGAEVVSPGVGSAGVTRFVVTRIARITRIAEFLDSGTVRILFDVAEAAVQTVFIFRVRGFPLFDVELFLAQRLDACVAELSGLIRTILRRQRIWVTYRSGLHG